MSGTAARMSAPLHGLFDKRVDGDDALLTLARLRFEQAGLAAEVYGGSADGLEHVLAFLPRETRAPMVHLSRKLDLLRAADQDVLVAMATRFGSRVSGFVLHDHRDTASRLAEVPAAASRICDALAEAGDAAVFVEYAAGCTMSEYLALGERLAPLRRAGLCVDIGHVGIRQARRRFADLVPQAGVDLAQLRADDPRLAGWAGAVTDAVAAGRQDALDLLAAVGELPNPVHLHLHDGHPLVDGLSDHFAFQRRLPVAFSWDGARSLPMLYGVAGLAGILDAARTHIAADRLSMTLEIHQGYGRMPLDPQAAPLFGHWLDLTNAERQNAWLAVVTESAQLVRGLAALDRG